MTQEELGRAAGIDYKHVGGIERGEHSPSFEAIERFTKVLGVEYHDLFQPDTSLIGRLEDELEAILAHGEHFDSTQMKQFFKELLTSTRRIRNKGRI